MDLALDDLAVGIDLVVDPHRRRGEKHHMHALLAIHGGEGFPKHEDVAEKEGSNILTGPAIDDLRVDLGFLVTAEIEEAEFPGHTGTAGDADFLRPVRHSRTLCE